MVAEIISDATLISPEQRRLILKRKRLAKAAFKTALAGQDIDAIKSTYSDLCEIRGESRDVSSSVAAELRANLLSSVQFLSVQLECGDIKYHDFTNKMMEKIDILIEGLCQPGNL